MMVAFVAFGSTGLATVIGGKLGPALHDLNPALDKFGVSSPFFWVVVLTTFIGFALSNTSVRDLEGVGASKIGSLFLYILVTTIGMQMNFIEIAKDPLIVLVGVFWILFHAMIMVLVAKLTKS